MNMLRSMYLFPTAQSHSYSTLKKCSDLISFFKQSLLLEYEKEWKYVRVRFFPFNRDNVLFFSFFFTGCKWPLFVFLKSTPSSF